MKTSFKRLLFSILGALFTIGFSFSEVGASPLSAFPTDGHTIYHLRTATVDASGVRAVVGSSFDGTVVCYKSDGTLVWKKKVNDYFPFDLAVADIDNDGFDEVFVATGGGTLDAYDNDGTPLWTYKSPAQLYQACPVKTSTGSWVILTGGVEEILFSIGTNGKLVKMTPMGDVVRHIRKADFFNNGVDFVAVAIASGARNGKLSIVMMNPLDLSVKWKKTDLGNFDDRSRFMSLIVHDVNSDGKKDIVVSGSWEYNGRILAYDNTGALILTSESKSIVPNCNYRMILLTHAKIKNTTTEYIFGLYANYLIVYNKNGIIQKALNCKYDFTNLTFDYETSTLYLGSSVSGGDGIYALRIDQTGWESAFVTLKPIGNLAIIENNIAKLKTQLQNFQAPAYQKRMNKVEVTATKPSGRTYTNLNFNIRPYVLQKYDNRTDVWSKDIDERFSYNKTADQIIADVTKRETNKESFYMVSGHGTAVYMPLETMKRAIAASPKYLKGFVFAEFQSIDSRMQEVIDQIIYPLARECSKAGKKIIFDQKNIFWGGTCYVNFWRDMLLNPEFHDVFLPALEESNSRTQEISLAGRVGLWSIGTYDKWSSRTISDNPCFDRMWEWSSPQVLSHYIRHQVYTTSLGSDDIQASIQQGPLTDILNPQLIPIYDMLEKGVIYIPKKDELLSVPDLCLGMKSPPSNNFLTDGINSHGYSFDTDNHSPKVFDRLGTNWGGYPIAEHDFSKYGYGCERRMLNFFPKTPYGLVAIVPDNINIEQFPRFKEKITTDGEFFYDASGVKKTPTGYKSTMLQKLEESASRLQVKVKGDVAWTVVRIDSTHVRVTLVDPGYTDPAERDAVVVLQRLTGLECKDILSGENLNISNNEISVKVPIGLFRIIDITHLKTDDISWSKINNIKIDNSLKISPNPGNGKVKISLSENQMEDILNYSVYNTIGTCLLTNKPDFVNNEMQVNISHLSKGLYHIVLRTKSGVLSAKYLLSY